MKYHMTLTHIDLTLALRSLVQSPESIAMCQAGISENDSVVELLGRPFAMVSPSEPLSDDGPIIIVGYIPSTDTVPTTTAAALASRITTTSPCTMGVLMLQEPGRSSVVDACVRQLDGSIAPVERVHVVGAGIIPLLDSHDRFFETLAPPPAGRWDRLRPVIGERVWHNVRSCGAVIVGCGRGGSLAAMSLAHLGVNEIVLVDPDHIEAHNLDMDGVTPQDIGRLKVVAVAEGLRTVHPHLHVLPCAASITSVAAVPLVKQCQLILCCVDNDGARWAAGVLAALYHKPLLDIGTGIFDTLHGRSIGADIRLIIPGDGCLLCYGSLAQPGHVAAMRRSYAAEVRFRCERDWRNERVGSLRSLNQIATGLGIRITEDFMAGRLTRSQWLQVTAGSDGRYAIETIPLQTAPDCSLCALRGLGDDGLPAIPELPTI